MSPNKKMMILTALGATLLPQMTFAAGAPENSTGGYNVTLICLVGLMLLLLFIIGMLAGTLRQLSFVVRDKFRKERADAASGTGKAVVMVFFLLISSVYAFAQAPAAEEAAKPAAPTHISGIPVSDFYLLVGIITFELVIVFALAAIIYVLLRVIRNKPELHAQASAVIRKSWFWDKFNSAVTVEKEKDIMLDHNYDGIKELDNSLPPWWKYGFYLTILVGIVYIYRFHVSHDGMSQSEEFAYEMQKGEEEKAAYLAKSANNVDENTVVALTTPDAIGNGKDVFVKNCAACHVADGGGNVGPNLTDDYWLHGGGIKDIFKSIKYGWQDKGMKSWKDDLSPKQIQEVASFIKSLKGSHPASPKAPQGELYIEAGPAKQDSTKTATVEDKK